MKIKNMFRMTVALLFTAMAVSCTDGNDWDTDGSYDRLFSTLDDGISVATDENNPTAVEVSFKTMPNVGYYIIEVSKDSLYDEVQMGGANAKVYGTSEDARLTSSPITIEGLDGDTKYYLRIKSMADGKTESRWSYYKDGSTFKTKAEQIMEEIADADRDESSITLRWTAGAEVTHLLQIQGEDTTQIVLGDEAKSAGTFTAMGLVPLTQYTFVIYNGTAKRGTRTASTTAQMPAADYKYTLDASVTQLTQDLLNDIAEKAKSAAGNAASYSATIGILGGSTLEFNSTDSSTGDASSLTIPDGMSVTFFGMPGERPTLSMGKSLNLDGSHAFVAFNNVKVVDNGAGYFVNQANECTIKDFTIEDCEMSGFKTAFIRMKESNVKEIETITLTNSVFDNMCSGYSFIHIDASGNGKVKNIAMESCTFSNLCAKNGKMFIYSKDTDMESIKINYCTFYNISSNGNYFVDFNKNGATVQEFTISCCLFGKTGDETTNKNFRPVNPTVVDVYYTSDFYKVIKDATATELTSDELFADPANGDFTVKVERYKAFGDQRWNVAEE